jgi:hypothetical protein
VRAGFEVQRLVVCTVISPVAIKGESREAWQMLDPANHVWRTY